MRFERGKPLFYIDICYNSYCHNSGRNPTMSDSITLQLTALSAGLLILRLVVGLAMAAHGTQKLFGWFGGHGLTATGGFFEMLGFHPGRAFALAAGATEIAS